MLGWSAACEASYMAGDANTALDSARRALKACRALRGEGDGCGRMRACERRVRLVAAESLAALGRKSEALKAFKALNDASESPRTVRGLAMCLDTHGRNHRRAQEGCVPRAQRPEAHRRARVGHAESRGRRGGGASYPAFGTRRGASRDALRSPGHTRQTRHSPVVRGVRQGTRGTRTSARRAAGRAPRTRRSSRARRLTGRIGLVLSRTWRDFTTRAATWHAVRSAELVRSCWIPPILPRDRMNAPASTLRATTRRCCGYAATR